MCRHARLNPLARLGLCLAAGLLANPVPAAESFTGQAVIGYRQVKVTDDETKYRQQLNLGEGARLFDLRVVFQPLDNATAPALMPDRITLAASGQGGDPAQNLRIAISKVGTYRLRYEHRRSDYFHEDLLLRPEDASIEEATGGDFHQFDVQRQRDRADLDINLSNRATLSLGVDHLEKRGDSTTTLDVQREEFELDKPVDETSTRYSLGFRYQWDDVTLTLNERWRDYDNVASAFLPNPSAGSDADAPTTLDSFFLAQPYDFNEREHHAGLRLRPDPRWDVRLDARLSDLDLNTRVNERAQGIDFTADPFTTDSSGTADIKSDLALYNVAIDWLASERIRLTSSAHRHHLDQHGDLLFNTENGDSRWDIDTTGIELGAEIAISDALTGALGISREHRAADSVQGDDSITDAEDADTRRTGYSAQLAYRPHRRLAVTLSTEMNRISDPYTLTSATDSHRWRLRGHYRWDNGLMLSAALRRTNRDNDHSAWSSATEQADLRLSWQTDNLSASLGFARVDQARAINQRVVGGARVDLFAIDYDAEADFTDANVRWRLNDTLALSASYRVYENQGSFDVERNDARAGIEIGLIEGYHLLASYRNLDYKEDRLEAFDAELWELALRIDW